MYAHRRAESAASTASSAGDDRPNVVVVVMDTVRARETMPVDPESTPTLAGFADEGTSYTSAFAAAPWTLPSHASLFTGTYPSTHGAHGANTRLGDGPRTLAESFRAAGYETAGVSNNTWVADEFGFARGFETFEERWGADGHPAPSSAGGLTETLRALGVRVADGLTSAIDAVGNFASPDRPDDGAEWTTRWIDRWLDSVGDEPFFLFANFIEPHLKYRPPAEYARPFLPAGWEYAEAMEIRQDPRAFDAGVYDLSPEELAALLGLYRGEIARLDARLADLRGALEAAGEWEDTVLVVVGDHGENVGDHGLLGHQYSIYDTVVHVPLVVTGGPFADGGRVDDLVQLVDLAPTLLDAAGIDDSPAREQYEGRSFHPASSSPPRGRVFAEYISPQPPVETLERRFGSLPASVRAYDRTLRMVRTRKSKLIRGSGGLRELYDVDGDRAESTNLVEREPERADALEATLDEWLSTLDEAETDPDTSADAADQVAGQTRTRLEELGYL